MLALEGARVVREQALDDRDRFGQSSDASAGGVEVDAGALVVLAHPAGPEAELEAPVGEHVDGRRLLGQHRRVVVVVRVHQRADPQRRGGVGGGHQRRGGRELVVEVVGHGEHRVAEVLGLAGDLDPLGA